MNDFDNTNGEEISTDRKVLPSPGVWASFLAQCEACHGRQEMTEEAWHRLERLVAMGEEIYMRGF